MNPERDRTYRYDERYYLPETTQPLPDDMLHLLRKELESMFFAEAAISVRFTDDFKCYWGRPRYWMRAFGEGELRGAPIEQKLPSGFC